MFSQSHHFVLNDSQRKIISLLYLFTFSIAISNMNFSAYSQTLEKYQLNTHQSISLAIPQIPTSRAFQWQKDDIITVVISDTFTPSFSLDFLDLKEKKIVQELSIQINEICTWQKQCKHTFIATKDQEIKLKISVFNYKFRYQIMINQEYIADQCIFEDTMMQQFRYNKKLTPKLYNLRFELTSVENIDSVDVILFDSFQKLVTNVAAGQKKQVYFDVVSNLQTFFLIKIKRINFVNKPNQEDNLLDHSGTLQVKVPNELLNGCNGKNFYDKQIRACPFDLSQSQLNETFPAQSSLLIHNYQPKFELTTFSIFYIRITIKEMQSCVYLFSEKNMWLTIRQTIGKDRNNQDSQFQQNQFSQLKCEIQEISCTFRVVLSPGNYSVNPRFSGVSGQYIYKYERIIDHQVVEKYYSMTRKASSKGNLRGNQMVNFQISTFGQRQLIEINIQSQVELFPEYYTLFPGQKRKLLTRPLKIQSFSRTPQYFDTDPSPTNIQFYVQPQLKGSYIITFTINTIAQQQHQTQVKQDKKQLKFYPSKQNYDITIRLRNALLVHEKIQELAYLQNKKGLQKLKISNKWQFVTLLVIAIVIFVLVIAWKRYKSNNENSKMPPNLKLQSELQISQSNQTDEQNIS